MTGMPFVCGESPQGAQLAANPKATCKVHIVRCGREEAIAKLRSAIAELVVEGIDTNTDFILKILENENFKTNQYDTSFVEKEMLTL